MNKKIKLPEIGEGINQVEISEILINIDDKVDSNDIAIIVETEKASMEIPVSASGTVKEILINNGDFISPGTEIFIIDTSDSKIDSITKKKIEVSREPTNSEKDIQPKEPLKPKEKKPNNKSVSASPSIRRFARELGCNLEFVSGTGLKGRITKEDVQSYIKYRLNQSQSSATPTSYNLPSIDFSKFGEIEVKTLNKIRRVSGQRLQSAWITIPHVTQFDKADITELNDFRKELNSARRSGSPKMSYLPFLMKALVPIFKEFPEFCSSLDPTGKNLILKKYLHIGIAVDTPNGLIVPVIKNIEKKSVPEIMSELTEISLRARDKKIKPDELQGSCFTISSLGGISGTAFTPIVNPPEVAILGISRTSIEPVYINREFTPRVIVPISLSYDHRVIDGAIAAKFTKMYCSLISNFKTIPDLNIY